MCRGEIVLKGRLKRLDFADCRCFRARLLIPAALVLALVGSFLGPITPASARYASLVIDGESGMELHSRGADIRKFPASLTKIMTLYMVFDALKQRKWTLGTRLKVSRRASRQPQTRLGLKAGQTITVRNAILALVTRSANDVATVVGENMAGTELRFAARMTSRARKIGMTRTTFRNASGLPNRAQLSTARDMARLAIAIREDFPRYYHYFRTKTFRFRGRTFRNHNNLLGRYTGTDGVKTGYTNASGYNLVASVKRNGRHLIGVVFGGKTGARRDRHMIRLLDRGFAKLTRIAKLPPPPLPMPRPSRGGVDVASATSDGIAALIMASEAQASRGDTSSSGTLLRAVASGSSTVVLNDEAPDGTSNARRWGIQVGAYSNARPAHGVIKTARTHLGPGLNHGLDKVERVRRRHGTIYRARILGLREVEARDACAILITKHLPCVPVPADVELAEAPAAR